MFRVGRVSSFKFIGMPDTIPSYTHTSHRHWRSHNSITDPGEGGGEGGTNNQESRIPCKISRLSTCTRCSARRFALCRGPNKKPRAWIDSSGDMLIKFSTVHGVTSIHVSRGSKCPEFPLSHDLEESFQKKKRHIRPRNSSLVREKKTRRQISPNFPFQNPPRGEDIYPEKAWSNMSRSKNGLVHNKQGQGIIPCCYVPRERRRRAGFQGRSRTSRLLSNGRRERKEREREKKKAANGLEEKERNIYIGRKRDANVFASR